MTDVPVWALVADAGCHKDRFLALGVCDAFRDAQLVADAIDDGLAGRRPLAEALADDERRRNEATPPNYQENLQRARLEPLPPPAVRLRAALRGNREGTNRFCLSTEGMIPREAFFNPGTMQRLLAAA